MSEKEQDLGTLGGKPLERENLEKKIQRADKKIKGTYLDFIDESKWEFSMVPRPILRAGEILSHGAFRVWTIIKFFARRPGDEYGTKEAWPSLNKIAKCMGVSAVQVWKYIEELEAIALLVKEKKMRKVGWGVINIYRMTDPEYWFNELGEDLLKFKKEKKAKNYKKQTKALNRHRKKLKALQGKP